MRVKSVEASNEQPGSFIKTGCVQYHNIGALIASYNMEKYIYYPSTFEDKNTVHP